MAHGERSRKRRAPWRRRALIVAGTASALVALVSAYSFGYVVYLHAQINRPDLDLASTLPNEPQNILIIGSDSREGLSEEEQEAQGTTEDVPGQRADTIILMRVDPRTGRTVIVHFPRDLRVEIAGTGQQNKINTAFEAGPRRMVETVEAFSGLEINHYVEVDFGGFRNIVDAMGGVRVCVDRPMVDERAGLNLPTAGCYVLNGNDALAFVRARHVGGDIIPDFSRIARQQQFLRAVLNRVLSPTSVFRLPSLARAVIDNITVDRGIDVIDINDIARRLRGLGTPDVDFRVVPSTPVLIDGVSYLDPVAEPARRLFARLQAGQPLGNVGLEVAQYTDLHAAIRVRVLDAGGDAEIVRDRLAKGGFEVLPTIAAPAGTATSRVLHRQGREPAAAAVTQFLAGLFQFEASLPSEVVDPAVLDGVAVGIVVGPDFPPPVRRL